MRGNSRKLWRKVEARDVYLSDVLWIRKLIGEALVQFMRWVKCT